MAPAHLDADEVSMAWFVSLRSLQIPELMTDFPFKLGDVTGSIIGAWLLTR